MPPRIIELIVLGKDQASKVIGKVGGAVSSLGSVAAGVATGGLALAAAATVGATVGIYNLTMAATQIEGTRQTLETLARDMGGTAEAMTALKEASRGMVSEADLMQAIEGVFAST